MVSKKSIKKIPRSPMVAVPEQNIMSTTAELPKPTLRSDADTMQIYSTLLDSAPDMPILSTMSEVTTWLDNVYRPWLNKVRHELPH
jgi:hypothetical protein